ncbi:MAG: HlyD family efflux transporter periplasmic adaptor subunit [Pseudomonadota bacterium]
MAQSRKWSRTVLTVFAVLVVAGAGWLAFRPQPMLVDLDTVTRGAMQVTIDEEGRTQVHDPYIVSTPVAGRLMRVRVDPGDPVTRGVTVVAQMRPTNPAALDVRTREQAIAAVSAAEAALRVARADLNAAMAENDLAQSDLVRTRQLVESGTAATVALDRVQSAARAAAARLDTAEAAISVREAEIANARAQLIGFDDPLLPSGYSNGSSGDIPLYAPIDGRILRIIQQSETILPAGAPVMEIGDITSDLEVVVDLLSSDAVQVRPGDRVMIEDWGGSATLTGYVTRVDPFGFTRFSALGVEEQRVGVTVGFESPPAKRTSLGHGFRVETRIVVWEVEDTLIVPTSALFRDGEAWAVFRVEDGRAVQRPVEVGRMNGTQAEVLSGLAAEETVVIYPSAGLQNGMQIAPRLLQ